MTQTSESPIGAGEPKGQAQKEGRLCPAPGVTVSGRHLTRYPVSQTAPVSYCPTCLGFGTVPIQR